MVKSLKKNKSKIMEREMRNIIVMLVAVFSMCTAIFIIPASAEMSPEEILSNADRARGNVEGIEW